MMKKLLVVYIFVLSVFFLSACRASAATTQEIQTIEPVPQMGNTPFTPDVFNPHPDPSDFIDAYHVPMRTVPAGEFILGSASSEIWPARKVDLDEFRIDKFEVTNILYKACVSAGSCTPPQDESSDTHRFYYSHAEFDHFPVIHVSWDQANAYCTWRGAGLPTEAQWEKAARGTDERPYPWGEQEIDCGRANYQHQDGSGNGNYCIGDAAEVGSFESGMSPYGVYDMAGNVWEWTADWYSETYYQDSPASNPVGPESGTQRVVRGGGWDFYGSELLAYKRSSAEPGNVSAYNGGFRCVTGMR